MKKVFGFVFLSVFVSMSTTAAFAADKAAATSQAKDTVVTSKMEPGRRPTSPMGPTGGMRSNFIMLSGAVSNIDMTDPSKVKIEVKNDRDNQVHIVEVTPATNITKVTDVSELKVGEAVRVMARKIDDKEVAMGVMFGKLKKLPAPPKMPSIQAAPNLKTPSVPVKSKPKK